VKEVEAAPNVEDPTPRISSPDLSRTLKESSQEITTLSLELMETDQFAPNAGVEVAWRRSLIAIPDSDPLPLRKEIASSKIPSPIAKVGRVTLLDPRRKTLTPLQVLALKEDNRAKFGEGLFKGIYYLLWNWTAPLRGVFIIETRRSARACSAAFLVS
tara:strand:- start:37 stop:510 length:474 start_codon:yes stop_codon:yes gene_type:complete